MSKKHDNLSHGTKVPAESTLNGTPDAYQGQSDASDASDGVFSRVNTGNLHADLFDLNGMLKVSSYGALAKITVGIERGHLYDVVDIGKAIRLLAEAKDVSERKVCKKMEAKQSALRLL